MNRKTRIDWRLLLMSMARCSTTLARAAWLTLLLAASVFPQGANQGISVDQAMSLAKAAANSGKYAEAESIYQKLIAALERSPGHPAFGPCLREITIVRRAQSNPTGAAITARRYLDWIRTSPADAKTIQAWALEAGLELETLGSIQRAKEVLAIASSPGTGKPEPALRLRALVQMAKIDEEAGQGDRQDWEVVGKESRRCIQLVRRGLLPSDYFDFCVESYARSLRKTTSPQVAYEQLAELLAEERTRQVPSLHASCLTAVAAQAVEIGDFAAAHEKLSEAIVIQRNLRADPFVVAQLLDQLGAISQQAKKPDAAAAAWREAAEFYEQKLNDAKETGASAIRIERLETLSRLRQQLNEPAAGILLRREALQLQEKIFPPEDPRRFANLARLGALLAATGQNDEARTMLQQVADFHRTSAKKNPDEYAQTLNNLAAVERAMGGLIRARDLLEEALELRRQENHPELAGAMNNLGSVLVAQGNYADAINLYQQAVAQCRADSRVSKELLATSLLNLAVAYKSQGQVRQASQFGEEAVTIYEAAAGPTAPGLEKHYGSLASLYVAQGKHEEARRCARKSLEICSAVGMMEAPAAGFAFHTLAFVELRANNLSAAEEHWRMARSIQEANGQTAMLARSMNYLGMIASVRRNLVGGEQSFREVLRLAESADVFPRDRYLALSNLAIVLEVQGKRTEAIARLEEAVDAIESPRTGTSGAESERAEFFAQFASAFDYLVEWNIREGDIEKAFSYMERGRNRTFLDQLELSGIDLRAGLSDVTGRMLVQREQELNQRIVELRQRVSLMTTKDSKHEPIAQEYEQAKKDYAAAWTAVRNASPVYRNMLREREALLPLADLQRSVIEADSLVLAYYLGQQQSYVLVVGTEPESVCVYPLEISPQQAEVFAKELKGVKLPSTTPLERGLAGQATSSRETSEGSVPQTSKSAKGPLTRSLAAALVGSYVQKLSNPKAQWTRGLTGMTVSSREDEPSVEVEQPTLASILLPAPVLNLIRSRSPKRLIIVPDGALHFLPFEALILHSDPEPRFVVDELCPIVYVPSLNGLARLRERGTAANRTLSLLTVGDPEYERVRSPAFANRQATRDAFIAAGGQLPPLPGTAIECRKVAANFPGDRIQVLLGRNATEKNVRAELHSAGILHLATHGLVDENHDNLFGAIALTPGDTLVANDDGFFSLNEILATSLPNCELAVLSACETNVGPERKLEGGCGIAQAFLIAGARRVVASHWSVADDSTAELMSVFFEDVSRSLALGRPVSYADSLQKARLAIRQDPKWSSPFFWAPFVLLGPN